MYGDLFSYPVAWSPYDHEQDMVNAGCFVDISDFSFLDELTTLGIPDANSCGLNNGTVGNSQQEHLAQHPQHPSMPPPSHRYPDASPYTQQAFHQARVLGDGSTGWKHRQSSALFPSVPPDDAHCVSPKAATSSILSFEAYRQTKTEVVLATPALCSAAPEGSIWRGGATKPSAYQQEHVLAERKRREKLSQHFIALSAIVPGLKKMDKASVLGDAIKYMKGLQERVQNLEEQASRQTVVVKKFKVYDDPEASCYSDGNNSDGGATSLTSPEGDNNDIGTSTNSGLPSIQAKMTGKSVLLRIQIEKRKGALVRLLAEVERMGLSLVNSSSMPFAAGFVLDVTVAAQMEDGFSMSAKELVRSLNAAISQMS